jgi:hypothetical protein
VLPRLWRRLWATFVRMDGSVIGWCAGGFSTHDGHALGQMICSRTRQERVCGATLMPFMRGI